MLNLTSQEIAHYRSALAAYPEALVALDVIEDCDGNLEDAATSLGIQVGQQLNAGDYLDGLAKRCRVAICEHQRDLMAGNLTATFDSLINSNICPKLLLAPIIIYVVKQGVFDFCEPLNLKLS